MARAGVFDSGITKRGFAELRESGWFDNSLLDIAPFIPPMLPQLRSGDPQPHRLVNL
jgi:hypothetical protein